MRPDQPAYPNADRLAVFVLGLWSVALLAELVIHPTWVPFRPGSDHTDLLISHLPNAEYLRESVWRHGQWPLWNAQMFAGQPFAADPLAGLWYPPNWLMLIPGVPLTSVFNALFGAHLWLAGAGLYAYLRERGLGPAPALFGALAFAGTPKLIAHLGAGHVSLIFAVAWTPWLMRAVERAAVAGSLRRGALAGLWLALTFLADVRWAFYAAALAAGLWIARRPPFARRRPAGGVWAAVGFALISLLLIAPLALPLGQFVLASSRSALTATEAAEFSLPPIYLLGLLIPDVGGFHEWMTYVGVFPLLLAIAGLRRATLFWAGLTALAIVFSLGANAPLFPLLFRLAPGLSLLRVPPRAWFLVALGIAVLAAHGLHRAAHHWLPRLRPRTRWPLPSAGALILGTLVLTALDLWRVGATLLEARPRPARPEAAAWIRSRPSDLFRVYSPSYSLPPGSGLESVDGVNPLQLAAFVRFSEQATGVPIDGYSVTVPPFASTDLASANAGAAPDPERLGLLNVKYVAAEFDLALPALRLQTTVGRTRVYENLAFRTRAWMEPDGPARVVRWSPNQIIVEASGPGQLVLSEVSYAGWRATVDGAVPVGIETHADLLRAVPLAEGAHTVVFEYHPQPVYLGLGLAGAGLVLLILILNRNLPAARPASDSEAHER